MFQWLKELLTWKRVVAFLKVIFKGVMLLLFDELKELAIEAAKTVAEMGLPTDAEKQKKFAEIMKAKAKEHGYELKDSVMNFLRETAVAYLKSISA